MGKTQSPPPLREKHPLRKYDLGRNVISFPSSDPNKTMNELLKNVAQQHHPTVLADR